MSLRPNQSVRDQVHSSDFQFTQRNVPPPYWKAPVKFVQPAQAERPVWRAEAHTRRGSPCQRNTVAITDKAFRLRTAS